MPDETVSAAERRRVRDRARTLLTVDETVAKIDATADQLGVQLDRFSEALDRFSVALDRFSDAAEKIDRVSGKLDTHTFSMFDRQVAPLLESPAVKTLVLDLEKLTYISSAGVRSVFKARKMLAARGGRVLVVNLQPQIRKVFDIVKAVPVADVFASQAELDDYLDAMQRKVLDGGAEED